MKVSIITATYNSSKTISDTLKSLEEQSYKNIEYIIVDGLSTDNTLDIIKANCTRISKIISEPDNGIYDALNKGIGMATGDIIGFLHSDDLFAYSDAVKDIVNTMKREESQAVYADLDYVSKNKTNSVIRRWASGTYNRDKLKNGWMPPHPTFYMKRELYQQFGGFDLNFKISADYESVLRYLWTNKVTLSYLPKTLIKMRVGGASNKNIKNIVTKSSEDIKALKINNIFWPQALLIKNFSKLPQFIKR